MFSSPLIKTFHYRRLRLCVAKTIWFRLLLPRVGFSGYWSLLARSSGLGW